MKQEDGNKIILVGSGSEGSIEQLAKELAYKTKKEVLILTALSNQDVCTSVPHLEIKPYEITDMPRLMEVMDGKARRSVKNAKEGQKNEKYDGF